jgi:hypothetical protein
MPAKKVSLVVSKEKKPLGILKSGQKFQVVSVSLAGGKGQGKPRLAARLCGGSGTCVAIIDIDKGDPAP